MSARACIVEMMEEIQLGVLTREALFQAAGNPEGHPDSAKLEARLQLPPGHMLLVVQLAKSRCPTAPPGSRLGSYSWRGSSCR